MGFLGLRKPFQKETVDLYPGVLVPLANANRHPSVAAEYARRHSNDARAQRSSTDGVPNADKDKENNVARKPSDDGEATLRTSSVGYSPYTIEGLRAEVSEEIGAGEKANSSYDCTFLLLFLTQ